MNVGNSMFCPFMGKLDVHSSICIGDTKICGLVVACTLGDVAIGEAASLPFVVT